MSPQKQSPPRLTTDIIIVGAGFSGCHALHTLRSTGYSAKILEAGTGYGGVWNLNHYPGARVDSQTPIYQFNNPKVWDKFNFSSKYPDHYELRDYFNHMADVLDLRRDTLFGEKVEKVEYDGQKRRWKFRTQSGLEAESTYAIFAVGASCKPYIPKWEGLKDFKGQIIHPSAWPEDFDAHGKKIGIIGQGASGIQIAQELAKEECELTIFIRTISMCIPMNQQKISVQDSEALKTYYDAIFNIAKHSTESSYPFNANNRSWHGASESERLQLYGFLWQRGGFEWISSNFYDTLLDEAANASVYDFWAQRIRERVKDPKKKEILAPLKQPYWVGTKRPSLEQHYYESIDQPNVELIDLKETPVTKFTERGIVTGPEHLSELDVVVVATGYDNLTGSLFDMNIHDKNGVKLQDKWSEGITSHLGMVIPGCPNAFYLYGPQAPSPLVNGPTFIELQVDWLAQVLGKVRKENIISIEASDAAGKAWRKLVADGMNMSLNKYSQSWWVGANIPGKNREPLCWFGGQQSWLNKCREALHDWETSGLLVEYDAKSSTVSKSEDAPKLGGDVERSSMNGDHVQV